MNDINRQIIEIKETCSEFVPKIIFFCDEIVNSILEEKIDTLLVQITQFTDAIDWLIEVNYKLQLVGIEDYLDMGGFKEVLNQINDALYIKDYMLISDIFLYEVKPLLNGLLE